MKTELEIIEDNLLVDARANIQWGKQADEVRSILIAKGLSVDRVNQFLEQVIEERNLIIVSAGRKLTLIGLSLLLSPICYYSVSIYLGVLYTKIFGATVVAGLYGVYKMNKGISLWCRPKSFTGDICSL